MGLLVSAFAVVSEFSHGPRAVQEPETGGHGYKSTKTA